MQSDAAAVLGIGSAAFALGFGLLWTLFRTLGKRVGLVAQFAVLVLALVLTIGWTWRRMPSSLPTGVVPWIALVIFWGGLVYLQLSTFFTLFRDGGPTVLLFHFIESGPGGRRTRQEIHHRFRDLPVLSQRIQSLLDSGSVARGPDGRMRVTPRGRILVTVADACSRLLGQSWGG